MRWKRLPRWLSTSRPVDLVAAAYRSPRQSASPSRRTPSGHGIGRSLTSIGSRSMDGCPLQSLDRGLLVRANADRVLGRRHIEPDDLRRPATDFALAPGFAP